MKSAKSHTKDTQSSQSEHFFNKGKGQRFLQTSRQSKPFFSKGSARGITPAISAQQNAAPNIESNLNASKGSGSPLPEQTRGQMESSFGADFSGVRVHDNNAAAKMSKDLNAQAFTYGSDIYFNSGKYDSSTESGHHLLAHELTHVVQQTGSVRRMPELIQRQDPEIPTTPQAPQGVATAVDTAIKSINDPSVSKSEKIDNIKRIKNFKLVSDEETRFKMIEILLDQFWVGPYDESALEAIWGSFDDRVIKVASEPSHFELWTKCIDRGADLDDLGPVKKLNDQFVSDIRNIATGYLFQNRDLVIGEMKRLGIPADEKSDTPDPEPGQNQEIGKMQEAAIEIAKLQKAQEQTVNNILVGYEPNLNRSTAMDFPISEGSGPAPHLPSEPGIIPVYFNPNKGKPPLDSNPEDRLGNAFGMSSAKVTPYDQVKQAYDLVGQKIADYLQLYPSLYSITREGKSAETTAFAETNDPAEARKQLGTALRKLFQDIETTQEKLDAGDLNPLDLIPIQDQLLLGGIKSSSGIEWRDQLPNAKAKEQVKDHNFNNALKELALDSAEQALFMLAPLAGGGALFVMLAGLAVAGGKLHMDAQRYETLSQASKTSAVPGTALVTPGQVDEAKMAVDADKAAFALAVLAVGVAGAMELFAALKTYRTKLELRETAAAVRSTYLGKPYPKGNVASAKLVLEDGNQMGFAETSRGKSPFVKEAPVPRSAGGQFEPTEDIIRGGIADTDPEYKIFSSAADILEKQYGSDVKGTLYLYSERQLCTSCGGVQEQFEKKFPNIDVQIFYDNPYESKK